MLYALLFSLASLLLSLGFLLRQYKTVGVLEAQRDFLQTQIEIEKAKLTEYKKAKAKEDEIKNQPISPTLAAAVAQLP